MARRRVLVQGGGIGGLTAAAALARTGNDVTLVELRDQRRVLGVGINQPTNALHCMQRIGALEACLEAGWQWDKLRLLDPRGKPLLDVDTVQWDGLPANNAIYRPALSDVLTRAAEQAGAVFRFGTTTTDLVPAGGPGGVDVTLTDGGTERFDVVVGFDGINSAVRRVVWPEADRPRYTGFAVWRAATKRHPDIRQICLSQAPDAKVTLVPLNEDLMYMANVTAEPGRPRQDPDQLLSLFRARLHSYSGLLTEIADSIPDAKTMAYTPIEEVTLREPWVRGRVVVAGDAAHASTPHLAQGGAMACEDAIVLAEELDAAEDIDAGLAAWEARRRPRATFVQEFSRALLQEEMGQPLDDEQQQLVAGGLPVAQEVLARAY